MREIFNKVQLKVIVVMNSVELMTKCQWPLDCDELDKLLKIFSYHSLMVQWNDLSEQFKIVNARKKNFCHQQVTTFVTKHSTKLRVFLLFTTNRLVT